MFQLFDRNLPEAQQPRPFTFIFEYELMAETVQDLKEWAARWDRLKSILHFDAPQGTDEPKSYSIEINVGGETHQIEVVQAAAA